MRSFLLSVSDSRHIAPESETWSTMEPDGEGAAPSLWLRSRVVNGLKSS
jgi:hypothetical protein